MRRLLSYGLLLGAVSGCGVGGTGAVEEIQPEELAALDRMTPASTSTPPEAETTAAGSVPVDTMVSPSGEAPPESTLSEPTTTVPTALVPLYFVNGSEIVAVETPVAAPPAERRILDQLGAGPPPEAFDAGVRTVVPPDLVAGVRRGPAPGLISVDLAGDLFQEIDSENQPYAVAQIVLTLTQLPDLERVLFTVDREPLRVYRRSGELTEPGEPVTYADYEELLADSAPPG